MPAAVDSSFDIAFWFIDQAKERREPLQPQKLHRLLYLSQAYFAVVYKGRKLMPALFVAEEMGPVEPTIFAAFARGEPDVEIALVLGDQVENFLDTMWRRFGAKDMEQLNKLCQETEAYTAARSRGHRAEIPLRDMQKAYAPSARPIPQTAGPKVMRSHDGRPVTVKSWAATLKPASPLKRK